MGAAITVSVSPNDRSRSVYRIGDSPDRAGVGDIRERALRKEKAFFWVVVGFGLPCTNDIPVLVNPEGIGRSRARVVDRRVSLAGKFESLGICQ